MMMRCQDCGNQAKKDCVYLRCRTCCKTRGFQCATHIKSTWVPVSRRSSNTSTTANKTSSSSSMHHHQQFDRTTAQQQRQQLFLGPNPNKGYIDQRDPSSSGNFPAEFQTPVSFRCVRVSSNDNTLDDQYAYQTSVSIGGHVFKGILYDQGPESSSNTIVQQQDVHQVFYPSFYPTPFNSFMPVSTPSVLMASFLLTTLLSLFIGVLHRTGERK